jgi:hypothetical protein
VRSTTWRLASGLGVVALMATLGLPPSAGATTRYVDEGGTGSAPCVKRSTPCDEIAMAVGAAGTGDRIYVGAGTYDDPFGMAAIKVIRDRRVFARGSGPAILDNGSVADGDESSAAVLPGDGALLRGLTIRSPERPVRTIGAATLRRNRFDQAAPPAIGSITPDCANPLVEISNANGGSLIEGNTFDDPLAESTGDQVGVCTPPGTEAEIRDNRFENLVNAVRIEGGSGDADVDSVVDGNVITDAREGTSVGGAGIFVRGSVPPITGNLIGPPAQVNPANAGLAFGSLAPVPTGATLARNRIEGFEVGVDAFETDGPLTMSGDMIVDNSTGIDSSDLGDNGGGNITARFVTVFGSSTHDVLLKNSELTLSSSVIGAQGIDRDDDVGSSTCAITFSRGPATSADSCEGFTTTGDPGFVDPANGDYHLGEGSPMIDATGEAPGGEATDIDGDPRPLDGDCPEGQLAVADIGADEFNCDPQTKVKGPKGRIRDRTPTYRLRSTDAGSTFRCKVDRKRYRRCRKRTTFHLHSGALKLRFRAVDPQGNLDPTPVKRTLKVVAD